MARDLSAASVELPPDDGGKVAHAGDADPVHLQRGGRERGGW